MQINVIKLAYKLGAINEHVEKLNKLVSDLAGKLDQEFSGELHEEYRRNILSISYAIDHLESAVSYNNMFGDYWTDEELWRKNYEREIRNYQRKIRNYEGFNGISEIV